MIRFNGLRAGYDGEERLHGLSYAVPEGKLVALIGPNGCGKSTLIKCMAGILPPMGGELRLGERSYGALSRKEMACGVSYMPQSRLVPGIPVKRLVSHGRYPRLQWGRGMSRTDREIVERAMKRTGVAEYAWRPVNQLSGGERQRAYLAMMLAQETPVMLLDEPTTYLDLSGQFQLMDLLASLRNEGRTVVLVLHDLALALEYADEVLLMFNGALVQSGAPDEIYESGNLQRVFHIAVERTPRGKYIFSKEVP